VTTDLNDWRLVYGDVELKFGTYLSGFPFVSQVDVGTPAARLNDVDHPNTDGIVFGSDTAVTPTRGTPPWTRSRCSPPRGKPDRTGGYRGGSLSW
jgi:hypothetical protein